MLNVTLIVISCIAYAMALPKVVWTCRRILRFVKQVGIQDYLRWILFRDYKALLGLLMLAILTGCIVFNPPWFVLWLLPIHAFMISLILPGTAPPSVLVLHCFDKRNGYIANMLANCLRHERLVSLMSGNMEMSMTVGGVDSIWASHCAWMDLVHHYCAWVDVIVLNLSFARVDSAFVERELLHVLHTPSLRQKSVILCADAHSAALEKYRYEINLDEIHWLGRPCQLSFGNAAHYLSPVLAAISSIPKKVRFDVDLIPLGEATDLAIDEPIGQTDEPIGLEESAFCPNCMKSTAQSVMQQNGWKCPECGTEVKPASEGDYEVTAFHGAGCFGWAICLSLVILGDWTMVIANQWVPWIAVFEISWAVAATIVVAYSHIMIPRCLEVRHHESARIVLASMYFFAAAWIPWAHDFELEMWKKLLATAGVFALALVHGVVSIWIYSAITTRGSRGFDSLRRTP